MFRKDTNGCSVVKRDLELCSVSKLKSLYFFELTRENDMKSKTCFYFCIIILLLVVSHASARAAANEQKLDRAAVCVKNKDYKTAYRQFKRMAQHGCPYSQCVVGIMHQKGVGTKKDGKTAAYWFEKSAAQGYNEAEYRLGKLHLEGNGVPRNVELAAHWLERAAQHGVVEAQYELGKLDVTERSAQAFNEGRAWLNEAASHGFSKAVELAGKLPPVPAGQTPVALQGVAQGVSNIKQSWDGYGQVASSLDALAAAH